MLSLKFGIDRSVWQFLKSAQDFVKLHRILLQASSLIVTEARNQLTIKGHVVTGNLRRSIQSESISTFSVRVGTYTIYAYYVEILPDGGYLYPAARLKMDEVAEFVGQEMLRTP